MANHKSIEQKSIQSQQNIKRFGFLWKHRFNIFRTTVLAALFISVSHLSYALTTEANLDRFILAAKKNMSQENFDRARYYLDRAHKLETTLPAEYYYLLGQTLAVEGDITKARQAFESYVNALGKKGEFYIASLEQITELEEIELSREEVKKAFSAENQEARKRAIVPSTSSISKESYLDQLKKLYLANSKQDALVEHINTILASTPYSGVKIQNYDNALLSYKISITSKKQILVTVKDNQKNKKATITTERVNVYGKDPFVTYECDIQRGSCWIRNLEGGGQWIIIGHDEDNAAELARAFTQLVKLIQGN